MLAQVGLAAAGLQLQLHGIGGGFGEPDADAEQACRLAGELAAGQSGVQRRHVSVEGFALCRQLAIQERTAAAQVPLHFVQCAARQADGHAALQAEEGRAHPWQELPGVVVQQPVAPDRHRAQIEGGGVAALQAEQAQVRRALQAGEAFGNRQDEGLAALPVFDRRRHHEIAAAQVGHPRQATVQAPAGLLRVRHHLQRLDPGKELHRVGQPGGAGQAAGQQVAEQALAQFLVGTLQQVLDEGALAPEDERRGQRARRHCGHPLHRVGERAAGAAEAFLHRHAEHAGGGQARQQRGGIGVAAVEGVGLAVEPVAQGRVKHGRHSLRRRGMPPGKRRLRPAGWSSDIAPARH
ncbi:hypothetical protein PAERUG_P3_North_West_16_VIM_2_07_06_04988 [Pseudomonas aeruginosa]|nr:hypothetical protein PAERUG_P18_London_17_VIM_2_04_10_01859 [Pseudomonas aeruginosa]CRP88268.1 hypothetical protein PAERUG_P3_North_West_16_VIM_2_07_06_04988 [Pseudomonas aeruginosa]